MSDKQQFKVGDKLVDFGQVHRIYKICKDTNLDGESEECIFYKPFFKSEKCHPLVCSVPRSNIEEANLRKPVSKQVISETLILLGQRPNGETTINIAQASVYLKENDPVETARLLRLLWLEQQDEEKTLSTRKKMMYENALKYLAEEIAVVQNIGLKKARGKIAMCLKKLS